MGYTVLSAPLEASLQFQCQLWAYKSECHKTEIMPELIHCLAP